MVARAVLAELEQLVRDQPPAHGGQALRYELERIRAGSHELTELDLVDALRVGQLRVPAAHRDPALRVLGGYGVDPRTRLGLPADADPARLAAAAAAQREHWHRLATHPAATAHLHTVATAATHTCGQLLTTAAAASSGADAPSGAPLRTLSPAGSSPGGATSAAHPRRSTGKDRVMTEGPSGQRGGAAVSYHLGIDLGTTFVAAAAASDFGIEMITLGDRTVVAPAVVYGGEDGGLVFGEAALQRALSRPERLQRDLKRSLGGRVDVLLGPTSYPVTELLAGMLADVVHTVTEQRGTKPDSVMLTHPANYREFRCELFAQVAAAADLSTAQTVTEPAAAAVHYATRRPLADGECLAVYDLGGGTFDATVVQNQGGSIVILAQDGIERLGGVDFDDALWQHCVVASHGALAELDFRDRPTTIAVGQLRQHISAAKEALSRDTEATIPVFLPDRNFLVTVTRAQFEDMIRASIESTIGTLLRTLRAARITPDQLSAVLLVGGSSRIPLVQQMLSEQLGRPTVVDAHPKYAVALGAAQLARAAAAEQPHQPPLISDDLEQTTVFAPVPPQPDTVRPETVPPETVRPETVQPETAPAEPPPSAPAGRPATDTGSLPLFGGYQGEEPGYDPGYDPGDDTDADATIVYGSAAPATAAGASRGGGSSVPPRPTAVAEHPAPGDTGHPSDSPSPPLGGARPRPGRSRSRLVTAVAVLTVVLVVLGWLTYTVVRPAGVDSPHPSGGGQRRATPG